MPGSLRKWKVPMDKVLNYISLARKAGLVELGEEPVGGAARAGKAVLVVVAGDASPHTWRRAKSFVAGTDQQCLRLPYSKDELGLATGRTSLAIAAFTDAALALACAQSLPQAAEQEAAVEALQQRVQRLKQRQKEARAHRKNVRFGKKSK